MRLTGRDYNDLIKVSLRSYEPIQHHAFTYIENAHRQLF